MRVAVVQMGSGEDKHRNLEKAIRLVEQASQHRAGFIALPEVFNYRGPVSRSRNLRDIAEDIPGPSTRPFLALAARHRVFILLGSLYEKIRGSPKVYNTSVLINPRGRLQAKYRKIHLFDAVIDQRVVKESNNFKAGRKIAVAQVNAFKVGLTICYDLRFPALFQQYGKSGAHVVCVPSSFTRETGKAHWKVLLRARAIENLCYVLAPNQIGRAKAGVPSFGHSLIISPWGEVLAEASADKEEIIYAPLSLSFLRMSRRILPAVVRSR